MSITDEYYHHIGTWEANLISIFNWQVTNLCEYGNKPRGDLERNRGISKIETNTLMTAQFPTKGHEDDKQTIYPL